MFLVENYEDRTNYGVRVLYPLEYYHFKDREKSDLKIDSKSCFVNEYIINFM